MRRHRLTALALVLAVAAVVVLIPTLTGPSTGPTAVPGFGADVGVVFQNRYPPAVVSRALRSAEDSGLSLARVTALWELTEPTPALAGVHRYDWSYDDRIASQLLAHHLRWVAVLAYAPAWASADPGVLHAAPRGTANYAAYAAAVARRYRGVISAFEIWNEENTPGFWKPVPNPVAYARLYEAARRAIHRADPGVPVLIGGLASGHPRFFRRLFRQPELRGAIDGVALHPYAATPAGVLAGVRLARALLGSAGFGSVPLYVTEYGWSSRPVVNVPGQPQLPPSSYAPAAVRPTLLVDAARELLDSGCDVRMAIFYAWLTPDRALGSPYGYYGVVAPDGAPTPATAALVRSEGTLRRARALSAGSC